MLDTDIFEISPEQFDDVRVVMTVTGGKIVYSRDQGERRRIVMTGKGSAYDDVRRQSRLPKR